MQIRTLLTDDIDILMRRRLERTLAEQADILSATLVGPLPYQLLFDCHEFGFCYASRDRYMPWRFVWFSEKTKKRKSQPRIVIRVTQTDQEGGERKIWYFALSHVGFLYCVAYERMTRIGTTEWYRVESYCSWRPDKATVKHPHTAVPEDWVFREAERLFRAKKRKHPRRKTK